MKHVRVETEPLETNFRSSALPLNSITASIIKYNVSGYKSVKRYPTFAIIKSIYVTPQTLIY